MIISASPFAALEPLTAYGLWKLRQDVFVVEQQCPYRDLDGPRRRYRGVDASVLRADAIWR